MGSDNRNNRQQGRNAGNGVPAAASGQPDGPGRFPGHDNRLDQEGLHDGIATGDGSPAQGMASTASDREAVETPGGEKTASDRSGFDALGALRERLLRGSTAPYGLESDPNRSRCPALWQLLTQRVGLSGRSKQTASIRIEATPTGFRATLSDLTLSVALTVDFEHLNDAYDALERAIRNPAAPWRDLKHGERATAIKTRDSKKAVDWENGKS